MRLQCKFSKNTNTYDIAVGSTLIDNFNETLESAKTIISNVPLEKKLSLHPFEYVRIFDLENASWGKTMLIDNFVETMVNIADSIYTYTISLMSETKLLEKIQLPNRTILHSLVSGQTTIREELLHLLELYIPKVKMANTSTSLWRYDYMIDFSSLKDSASDIYKKFNVPCPDITLSKPTLRQALTQLMEIVGCLPMVKEGALSFLDLRKDPTAFNTNGCNYIQNSLSSDSYINTITTIGTQIIDENNQVVNEALGFRDKDNVFLKHTENIKLTTTYPIAKINKLELCAFSKGGADLLDNDATNGINEQFIYRVNDGSQVGDVWRPNGRLQIMNVRVPTITDVVVKFFTATITSTGSYHQIDASSVRIVETKTYASVVIPSESDTDWSPKPSVSYFDYETITFTYNGKRYSISSIVHFMHISAFFFFNYKYDITPIVFETGARKMLSTDPKQVGTSFVSLEKCATNYYTTLSFDYGKTTIVGFSNVWSWFSWWGTEFSKSFLENLYSSLTTTYPLGDGLTEKDIVEATGHDIDFINIARASASPYKISDMSPYTQFMFNISYQPMNSINVKFTKKNNDIPYSIEQLDNQEESILAFDSFSKREQQKVNRLGNNTIQISQRIVGDLSSADINEVNTLYKDSVVFKREISIYNDFVLVNYTASKDYVLKDYFTSIQTKYRAYEYIDYQSTTIRKENTKVFVDIDTNYYNGDDKLWFGNKIQGSNIPNISWFVSKNNFDSIAYCVKATTTYSEAYKDEASVFYNDNANVVLNYQDFDSVSGGIGIQNPQTIQELGGYIQKWYIRNGAKYDDKNTTIFTDDSLYDYSQSGATGNILPESDIQDKLIKFLALPYLPSVMFNPDYYQGNMLTLCDDNTSGTNALLGKTYYKSQNEVLNESIQLEMYSSNSNIQIGDWWNDADSADYELMFVRVVGSDLPTLETKNITYPYKLKIPHTTISAVKIFTHTLSNNSIVLDNAYIHSEIALDNELVLCYGKITYATISGVEVPQNIIINKVKAIFTTDINKSIYFNLNDTKSKKVFVVENGMLVPKYNISVGTRERRYE